MLECGSQSASRCQCQVTTDDGIGIAGAITDEADASQNQFRRPLVGPSEAKRPAFFSARINDKVEAGCSSVGYLSRKRAASLEAF
jgi:hypothetical protein